LGYRVLVAVNNPIARFLLEVFTNPPLKGELQAALAALGGTHIGNQRIEILLRDLYTTTCAQCELTVEAQAFIWERGAQSPSGRIYRCTNCGDHGEKLASQRDAQKSADFTAQSPTSNLHLARALERVAPLNDPDRVYAKEAIESYLPRTVYALFTLVNKLDTIPVQQRKLASALILSAFDQCNTLWAYPTARERPRVLSVPSRFREQNVWYALEEAIDTWPNQEALSSHTGFPLHKWPELPPADSGICIFEGRIKDLADQLERKSTEPIEIKAVLTNLPRPNQAYWTLSALWSGWLWGGAAAAPFKSVLRRRRYDWAWHSTALGANFTHLLRVVSKSTPFLGLMPEVEPGFLSAALIAAEIVGLDLEGIALRENQKLAQIHWICGNDNYSREVNKKSPEQIMEIITRSSLSYIRKRGEPVSYLQLHANALTELAQSHLMKMEPEYSVSEAFSHIHKTIVNSFSRVGYFRRYGSSKKNIETGRWFLEDSNSTGFDYPDGESLVDRVEKLVVNYLIKNDTCSFDELERSLCEELCGPLIPERDMVRVCLESYGEISARNSSEWCLRDQDKPQSRQEDLLKMRALINELGARIGYQVSNLNNLQTSQRISSIQPVYWSDESGKHLYVFFVIASAILGNIVYSDLVSTPYSPALRKMIVIPGGRAGLVHFKIEHDPRLAEAVGSGWEFVKFRHLRRLSDTKRLNRENITEQLLLDRLANTDPQMQFW